MTIYEYGNPDADTVLIQLTGDHELSVLKNEVEEIRKRTSTDFRLIAAKVDDWNYELSPWKASAVFGNEDFGDGAVRTLEQILTLCTDKSRTYYIGGYSLAGLFSLWAAYQTDVFSGIAAASPSVCPFLQTGGKTVHKLSHAHIFSGFTAASLSVKEFYQ